jgi:hypothetical protein
MENAIPHRAARKKAALPNEIQESGKASARATMAQINRRRAEPDIPIGIRKTSLYTV